MTTKIKKRIIAVFIVLAVIAIFSAVLMLLWNWLLPAIFGVKSITYGEAVGLLLLSRIIFSGWGNLPLLHQNAHHAKRTNQLQEKWLSMSNEERENFLKAQ